MWLATDRENTRGTANPLTPSCHVSNVPMIVETRRGHFVFRKAVERFSSFLIRSTRDLMPSAIAAKVAERTPRRAGYPNTPPATRSLMRLSL